MPEVASFSTHLYCDNAPDCKNPDYFMQIGSKSDEYVGETRGENRRSARNWG